MGNFFSNSLDQIRYKFSKQQFRILITGLDGAGKTTMVCKLRIGMETTIPTIGYHIEYVGYKNIPMISFDVGGSNETQINHSRQLLSNGYYKSDVSAIIWCVDSTDSERMAPTHNQHDNNKATSKEELHFILNHKELEKAKLLIFSTKMDLHNAMELEKVLEYLDIMSIKQDWFAIRSCMTTGDNIYEGLEWISYVLKHQNINKFYKLVPDWNQIECKSWFSKMKHGILLQNRKKTILLICGWMRNTSISYKLNVPNGLCKLVHLLYQDVQSAYDQYHYL
eukprot:38248_1